MRSNVVSGVSASVASVRPARAVNGVASDIGDQIDRLRRVVDHLASTMGVDDPAVALNAVGVQDVRTFTVSANCETQYLVVGVAPNGREVSARAWSPGGAVATILADLEAPAAEAA